MLQIVRRRMESVGIDMAADDSAVKLLAELGFDPVYGARPLRRAIQQQIEDRLSEQMLEGKLIAEKNYVCSVSDGEFVFIEDVQSN